MKKGFVALDEIIGLVIFLMIVSVSFYYLSYISKPQETFSSVLKQEAFDFAENIEGNITWTVYRMPVIVTSGNTSKATIEKKFYPSQNVDVNSIIVKNENKTEINSSFDDNTIIFTPNVVQGKNNYFVLYTKDTALDSRTYATDLNAFGVWVNNSLMNVSFATTGISKIEFNGLSVLQGVGANLTTSSVPDLTSSAVRAKRAYDNGIDVKIYNNNSKIIVTSNHTFNPVIYITKTFTNQYNGSVNPISSAGLQFNSVVDFLDIYGVKGISVIGNNLNVSLYNNTYNEVRLYNVTDFEIYLHDGDYTNALTEKDMYLNPHESTLLIPEEVTGISLDRLTNLNGANYKLIKETFSNGIDFNITTGNTTMGIERPIDVGVVVVKYPVLVVDRLAETNNSELDIAVWIG